MEVKYICLKLTNSDTIIGILDTECDESLTIDSPTILTYDFDLEGNFGIKFLLYMPYSTETLFTFNRKYVMLQSDVSLKVQEYYTAFILGDQEKDSYTNPIDKSKLN